MPEVIIYSFSVAACFLFGLLSIFYFPHNNKGNVWFGVFLVSLGFAFLSKVTWQENLHTKFPHIIPVSELSRFIIAPSFYLSVWYYTHLSKIPVGRKLLHFGPAIIFALFVSFPYFLSTEKPATFIQKPFNSIIGQIMRSVLYVQAMSYWVLSYRLLKKHSHNIQLFSSQKTERNLIWLLGVMMGLFFIILLSFLIKGKQNLWLHSASAYLYLVFVLFMVYSFLKQKEVFLKNETDNMILDGIINSTPEVASQKSTPRLSDEALKVYQQKLDYLLVHEEVFTDPDIDLAMLAGRIGISMNDLSFLINTQYSMNFYAIINQYRIQKVKEMLGQDRYSHLTILGIAYEAGFTSKSTFNSVFKKATGYTPSAYLKKNI